MKSGECNNYPLLEHIAAFGKPVILSTGMNTMSITKLWLFMKAQSTVTVAYTNLYQRPFI
jgi:N-acetylneuraminate synthase